MCIRDRPKYEGELSIETAYHKLANTLRRSSLRIVGNKSAVEAEGTLFNRCLLYTSDAADERSSVDLGGRRIIKKKKKQNTAGQVSIKQKTRIITQYKQLNRTHDIK